MIFVDASALIAIITGEPQANMLETCLALNRLRCTSPLAAWETMSGLCRSYRLSAEEARDTVKLYADEMDLQIVTIGAREYELAAAAYEKFGKGRHKAALNMGDCFAYACTKANRAKLLFIGDDFNYTDIALARDVSAP